VTVLLWRLAGPRHSRRTNTQEIYQSPAYIPNEIASIELCLSLKECEHINRLHYRQVTLWFPALYQKRNPVAEGINLRVVDIYLLSEKSNSHER
jgi:hypothetical protein